MALHRDVVPVWSLRGGQARMTFDHTLYRQEGGGAVRRALVIIACERPRHQAVALAHGWRAGGWWPIRTARRWV